jgi:phenylpropionate dioxygenase-like ring-hydroxylating dioxygenase large terminal subunit
VQVCGSRKGHADGALTCPYHAWRFHFDGTLESVPLEKGYRDTNFKKNDPAFAMTPAASVDIYRGFVFAKLDPSGPSLMEWMGPAKIAIDDMCDRSPVGRVEVVQPYNRVVQRSNWKFFMENQIDTVHPSVTHMAVGQSAAELSGTRSSTLSGISCSAAIWACVDRPDTVRTACSRRRTARKDGRVLAQHHHAALSRRVDPVAAANCACCAIAPNRTLFGSAFPPRRAEPIYRRPTTW